MTDGGVGGGVRSETADRGVGADAIVAYRALLERYHRTLDLMSDRGLAAFDAKLADAEAYAAAVQRWSQPGHVVDVGSGAGLPGVVIAARAPERHVVLVERRRRRATFLELVRAGTGLSNVTVVASDVQRLDRAMLGGPAGVVTAQAVAGWRAVYGWTTAIHGEHVVLVARRGQAWAEEVAAFEASLGVHVDVLAAEPQDRGGTLVVLRAPGGRRCR